MHEMGIATSIIAAVRTEAKKRPGQRPVAVGLRLGELSGVNADALRFSFEVLVKGTDLEPLELEIEHVRRRQRCPACGGEFDVIESDTRCPTCGEPRTRLIAGDEMNIIYLEVEE